MRSAEKKKCKEKTLNHSTTNNNNNNKQEKQLPYTVAVSPATVPSNTAYQHLIDVHCPSGTLGVTLTHSLESGIPRTAITKINRGSVLRRFVKVDDHILAVDGEDVTRPKELVSKMVAARNKNPVRILRVGRGKRLRPQASNSSNAALSHSVSAGSKRASPNSTENSNSGGGFSSSTPPVTVDLTDEVDKLREENRRLQEQLRLALATTSSPNSGKKRHRT